MALLSLHPIHPSYQVDVDREKAKNWVYNVADVFYTMSTFGKQLCE